MVSPFVLDNFSGLWFEVYGLWFEVFGLWFFLFSLDRNWLVACGLQRCIRL
jgi:hypothetical protein